MMGQHDRSEALFYYFRLEDQVPETHLLRLIEKHISFDFVRAQLKDSYSDTGRPSIDPELLLRILLIGYLYGITSERKLVEELRMHLAWRWFTGLGFNQEIPHHSTFSKNRHGRFQESKLFEQLFEQIVRQCMEVGLVQGKQLSVDGSFVEANAAKESRIPREQLAEAAQVHHTVRQYLREVEEQNPVEGPVHEQDQVSTTDPDSTYATKGGTPARLGVESRTGAVALVSRWLLTWLSPRRLNPVGLDSVSCSRSSNRTGRFPASGSRKRHTPHTEMKHVTPSATSEHNLGWLDSSSIPMSFVASCVRL